MCRAIMDFLFTWGRREVHWTSSKRVWMAQNWAYTVMWVVLVWKRNAEGWQKKQIMYYYPLTSDYLFSIETRYLRANLSNDKLSAKRAFDNAKNLGQRGGNANCFSSDSLGNLYMLMRSQNAIYIYKWISPFSSATCRRLTNGTAQRLRKHNHTSTILELYGATARMLDLMDISTSISISCCISRIGMMVGMADNTLDWSGGSKLPDGAHKNFILGPSTWRTEASEHKRRRHSIFSYLDIADLKWTGTCISARRVSNFEVKRNLGSILSFPLETSECEISWLFLLPSWLCYRGIIAISTKWFELCFGVLLWSQHAVSSAACCLIRPPSTTLAIYSQALVGSPSACAEFMNAQGPLEFLVYFCPGFRW